MKLLWIDKENEYVGILDKTFDLVTAENCEVGLDMVKRYEPAVIVLEIALPGSMPLLQELKNTSTKVVVLTSSLCQHLHESSRLGIYAYLNKQVVSPDEMVKILKSMKVY